MGRILKRTGVAESTMMGGIHVPPFLGWVPVIAGAILIGTASAIVPALVHATLGAMVVCGAICWVLLRAAGRRPQGARLASLLGWAILLRLVFVCVHLLVGFWFYGGTDSGNYVQSVNEILDNLVAGRLSLESAVEAANGPGNVGTVSILTVIAFLTGPTIGAMFLVSGALSAVSGYLFLRAYQRAFPSGGGDRFMTVTMLFLPAVVFWSAYLGRDFICALMIALVTYCLAGVLNRLNVRDGLGITAGLVVLLAVRPPIVIGVTLGVGAALVARLLLDRQISIPARIATASMLMLAVIYVSAQGLAQIGIEEIAVDVLAERAQQYHAGFAGYADAGMGSALALEIEEPTFGAVARSLPKGIFTLMFRPFLWEAHNVLAVAAGAENLVLLALVVWRWRILAQSVRSIGRQPFLLYVVVAFVAIASVLSFAWNLGTMARLRTMVMPFVMMLLAGVDPREGTRSATGAVDA